VGLEYICLAQNLTSTQTDKDKGKIMKSTKQLIYSLIITACVVAPTGDAALSPLGSEFPLLGDIQGHQKSPHVALSSGGGFVVWQTMAPNGQMEQIMVQRLSSDMTGVGVPVHVSQANNKWNEMNPRVALLPGSGAVIAWVGGTRAATDVYVRFINSNGSFISPDLMANMTQLGHQRDPDVAVTSDGNVVVVWSSTDQDGDGEGIFGQQFTTAGAKLGGEFRVNTTTAMNQSDPAVTGLKNGGFVVSWISESAIGQTSSGAPNLRGNVMGRVFSAGGGTAGQEIRINSSDALASSPVLTGTNGGGFMTAWVQRDEENTRNLGDIMIRMFNANGTPAGSESRHNTYLRGQQDSPELVQLADDALVAWTSYGQDGSGAGVVGRLVSGGTEFQINSQGLYHQSSPAVATDGANKFLAVWVNTINPKHSILSAQRYVTTNGDLDGVVDVTAGQVQIVEAENRQQTPTASPELQNAASNTLRADAVASLPVEMTVPQPPVVAPRPPSPVAVSAAAPPKRATSAAPSTRAGRASLASRQLPKSSFAARSFSAGQNALRSTAMQRSFGGRGGPGMRTSPSLANRLAQSPGANRGMLGSRSVQRPTPSRSFASAGKSGFDRAAYLARRSGMSPSNGLATRMAGRQGTAQERLKTSRSGVGSRSSNGPVHASLRDGSLQWKSPSGSRFQVQGSNDLQNWNNVGAARSGRGGADSFAIDRSNGPRYYRVVRRN